MFSLSIISLNTQVSTHLRDMQAEIAMRADGKSGMTDEEVHFVTLLMLEIRSINIAILVKI